MSTYKALIETGEDGGWSGFIPDLPGILGMGDTREEVLQSLRDGFGHWSEAMLEDGRAIPEPSGSLEGLVDGMEIVDLELSVPVLKKQPVSAA